MSDNEIRAAVLAILRELYLLLHSESRASAQARLNEIAGRYA